jgi:hypothetical protein
MEKAEQLVTTIFEIMEEDSEHPQATSPMGDDEPMANSVLHGQDDHKLMELCF